MSSKIIYFEGGVTERDQYWYRKGKSEGFIEGSQALLDLYSKIEMLKLKSLPIILQSKEIISTKKEV